MIKKSLLPIALILMMALLAGCGGGAGSSSAPAGVDPAVPSIVQLLPVQQIVQTNSSISLRAKVLDGNGAVIAGVPVVFTNLSLLGVLSSTTATTNSMGYATVSIFSTDSGFATIQAEVNTGSGKVRDKKTVFFSVFDLFPPTGAVGAPTLTLAVDNNNDGSFNDPSDFVLLDTTAEAIIRATVLDGTGAPVLGDTVTFGADSTEATFPDGAVKQTDSAGEAFVRLKVVPAELRDVTIPLNVNAVSTNTKAFNVLTLYLEPVTVGNVKVTANPKSIQTGGTSTITANVTTTAGVSVPNGTSVNFTITPSTFGGIPPYSQTTNGLATATYTAPATAAASGQSVTVTATVTGVSGSDTVIVTPPPVTPPAPVALSVTPPSITVVSTNLNVITFTIKGGTGPYTVTSSNPLRACKDAAPANGLCTDAGDAGLWTGVTSTFSVTLPSTAPVDTPGSVILNITDSAATTASVTATITIL
ncbi:MAG: Ig-like domain-containing protein [Nitrospiraceae bacterium]|nr:Ig-like domain-containing protein [Nitrospiraceae bacterium]